jgi:hypothetical protein
LQIKSSQHNPQVLQMSQAFAGIRIAHWVAAKTKNPETSQSAQCARPPIANRISLQMQPAQSCHTPQSAGPDPLMLDPSQAFLDWLELQYRRLQPVVQITSAVSLLSAHALILNLFASPVLSPAALMAHAWQSCDQARNLRSSLI